MSKNSLILVTGATGYIGGRLIPELLARGWKVRAAARSLEKLKARSWAVHPGLELVQADLFDLSSMICACSGCSSAFYLVHSMNPEQKDFEEADRKAARHMAQAAAEAGMERILYLGGLGEDQPDLSKHLRSRAETAKILQSGKVPVTVLRAAMIIGSGSASFEILRYLVDRLPMMVTPRWVDTPSQPIGIRNVIDYLAGCLDQPQTIGQSFDIGGPEVLTYRRLMEIYAEEAGLATRWIIPVPVLTPRLSSYWIHLVTPIPAALARPLAEGLRNPVICHDKRILELVPQKLLTCREAIHLALEGLKTQTIETHWTDAGKLPPVEWLHQGDAQWAGGTRLDDRQEILVQAPGQYVWEVVSQIGGEAGWYHADFLWRLRGFIDRIFGGVGLRRGRRSKFEIKVGDSLDFWRVLEVKSGECITLGAEMKLPGKAVLEFRLEPLSQSQTRLIQTARFLPRGLMGIFYWYGLKLVHDYVFKGMIQKIARRAEKNYAH